MKAKTKLIMGIMSICLVCAVFAIGVFALRTANLKIGGDVSFSATGVEVDIKNATLTGATTNNQVLAIGSINTTMTQTDIDSTFQNWQTLELDFNENADDIELKFDIANTSTNANNYIEIDYDYSFTTANPNVDVFPGDENAQGAWENNNYILAPKGATPAAGDYETFTLKFRVLDKELNVKADTKVNLTISLKHVAPIGPADGETVQNSKIKCSDGIIYTLDTTNNTASLGSDINNYEGDNYYYNGDENVVIAPVVSDGTNNYIVKTIEDYAFFWIGSGNSKIKTVIIPNCVTKIGKEAFSYSPNLTTVTLPKGLTTIENSFGWNFKLTTITMQNNITSIGADAFSYCEGIISITIPNSVISIGSRAFYCCTSLASIIIPSGVTNIGEEVFGDCKLLYSIIVESGNSVYDSRNRCNAIIETVSNTLIIGCCNTIIPNGVTAIGDNAFYGCCNLITITIPSSVMEIGESVFSYCYSLVEINNLSNVEITSTSYGLSSSYNPDINIITPTNGKTSQLSNINDYVFYEYEEITYLVAYRGEQTELELPTIDGGYSIRQYAFYYCVDLSSITIPSNVSDIGELGFFYCINLTSITIPSGVTKIGSNAFYGCSSLTSVKFAETTGWWCADSEDATSGTAFTFSETDFEENANILKNTHWNKYWFRTVA